MSLFKYLSILYNFVAKGASHYSSATRTVLYPGTVALVKSTVLYSTEGVLVLF